MTQSKYKELSHPFHIFLFLQNKKSVLMSADINSRRGKENLWKTFRLLNEKEKSNSCLIILFSFPAG